ncbi:hypothetical protein CR513_29636, partial [Mucuna pruriens]
MEILLGFYSHNEKNKVCKLKKVLYGLKQSPQTWFGRFSQVMISLRYKQSQCDHNLFIKHYPYGKLTLLLVYVMMKLKYFLRIRVAYSKQVCIRSPQGNMKFGMQNLRKIGNLGCKTLGVLIEQNHRIECKEMWLANLCMLLGKGTFRQLKGSSNAYYAESIVDRRSTFGYCMFLGGNLVTLRSKKQNVIV